MGNSPVDFHSQVDVEKVQPGGAAERSTLSESTLVLDGGVCQWDFTGILMGLNGIYSGLMGIYSGLMGYYSGLMGYYSGLMGYYSGLMGFYWDFNGIVRCCYWDFIVIQWDITGIYPPVN